MDSVRDQLSKARSVVVMTGAGISAESGVPTAQGGDAKWGVYKVKHLSDHRAFQFDPKTVWEWYYYRRKQLKDLDPNLAHNALVELESRVEKFTLITQNEDGLHTKAGSKNVIEIHGNIWQERCTECGKLSENYKNFVLVPPMCQECGELLRPNVVWVGERLPPQKLEAAKKAVAKCDFMLIIGISGFVQTAVSLAMLADQNGAFIVDVNKEKRTIFSDIADMALWGRATKIVPSIVSLTYKFAE